MYVCCIWVTRYGLLQALSPEWHPGCTPHTAPVLLVSAAFSDVAFLPRWTPSSSSQAHSSRPCCLTLYPPVFSSCVVFCITRPLPSALLPAHMFILPSRSVHAPWNCGSFPMLFTLTQLFSRDPLFLICVLSMLDLLCPCSPHVLPPSPSPNPATHSSSPGCSHQCLCPPKHPSLSSAPAPAQAAFPWPLHAQYSLFLSRLDLSLVL